MFIIWRIQEYFAHERRWAEFNSSKVCSFSLLFFISFLALTEINIVRWNSQWFCILACNVFTSKHYRSRCLSRCRSRWENLDRGQYPIQPIKFVNLVVPSLCETEPYNKHTYKPTCIAWTSGLITSVARRSKKRIGNKSIPSCFLPLFQHESWCTTLRDVHANFFCARKLTRHVVHERAR